MFTFQKYSKGKVVGTREEGHVTHLGGGTYFPTIIVYKMYTYQTEYIIQLAKPCQRSYKKKYTFVKSWLLLFILHCLRTIFLLVHLSGATIGESTDQLDTSEGGGNSYTLYTHKFVGKHQF